MTKARAAFVGLRGLILAFVLLAVLATLCNSLAVAYKIQRDALIHQALASNRAYAYKLASTISEFLGSIHQRLEYHPDHARIGDTLTISASVDAALKGEEGAIDAVNFEGVPMLSGYAQVPGRTGLWWRNSRVLTHLRP